MHIHILGICGTFMGGLALIAREAGHRVTGSDANVYPPMSTQLEEQGIELMQGYLPEHLQPAPDLVVVGNAMSRGNPAVEYMLDAGLAYTSGPQWLSDNVLQGRQVLACAGTHGKTSTSSMLAWILEHAGLSPGFLIGGVPGNFGLSARLGESPWFVIEADEYDSAFFDKRSKFVHYRPAVALLNNLEFDHADIFDDLAAIQRQFHHLLRTVPGSGRVLLPVDVPALDAVLAMGCWTPVERISPALHDTAQWQAQPEAADGSRFAVLHGGKPVASVDWELTGRHNISNALGAIAAAEYAGVAPEQAVAALSGFAGIKRRMELRGQVGGVSVYDDFAHHPTAIATTLEGLRAKVGDARVLAVIEPRSNTMRMGVHRPALQSATAAADAVFWYQPADQQWDLNDVVEASGGRAQLARDIDALVHALVESARPGDYVVIMSNGGFGGIHDKLLQQLEAAGGHSVQ